MRSLRDHMAARRNGSSPATTTLSARAQRPDTSMGPNHNAIVLSDTEPERRRATFSEILATIEDLLHTQLDPHRPDSPLAFLREGRAALDLPAPRTATAGDDTQQARRTSLMSNTAPFRFGPRPDSSTTSPRPSQRRAIFESHLRDAHSTDASTTLGRRVAARAAAGTSGSSRVARGPFSSLMEDLRRESPEVMDRFHTLENQYTREQDRHRITQHNANINNMVQEARAMGIPIDEGASGSRAAESSGWSGFPSPLSSSRSSPVPEPLSAVARPPHPVATVHEASASALDPGTWRNNRSDNDARLPFAEQMAQLNAEMERQRERQNQLLARISARHSVSAFARDNAGGLRPSETVPSSDLTADRQVLGRRLVEAYENYRSDHSDFDALLRVTAMRESTSTTGDLGDIEDDDPFSWLMPSRTPPAEPRRPNRSVWLTSRDRLPQDWGAYSSTQFGAVAAGRLRRDRAGQTGTAATSSPGRNEGAPLTIGGARRRRRGWGTCMSSDTSYATNPLPARLDHDGNEIPTDEEEEYERNRAQMRTRALQITQPPGRLRRYPSNGIPPIPPPPPPGRRLSFVPTTQSLPWSGPLGDDVRVRLNPSGADLDRPVTPHDESDEEEYWRDELSVPLTIGSSAPFVPSLLPLPRVDLNKTQKARKGAAPIRVADPMPAYCAGR